MVLSQTPMTHELAAILGGTVATAELSVITGRERTPEQLLACVAEGDRDAFSELYDHLVSRVLVVVRRCLVDPAQSEEVAQEVFLQVWQTAPRYESSQGAAITWILTLAHRRAVDRVRASQSSRDRDLRLGIRDLHSSSADVAETVETLIEWDRAVRAMQHISALQRQVITLTYSQGLSQNEIAAMLDVPVGTIKTRLRDGILRLRRELGMS